MTFHTVLKKSTLNAKKIYKFALLAFHTVSHRLCKNAPEKNQKTEKGEQVTMKKNLPSLRICMFGKTVITYGNKPIPFGKKSITKVQKLLMIMCYCGVEGIARNKLLEDL